jgi:hypothetical protein
MGRKALVDAIAVRGVGDDERLVFGRGGEGEERRDNGGEREEYGTHQASIETDAHH